MRLPWIAQTGIGRMLADYVSASWTGGRTVAVFSLADEPVGGGFRQATFAAAFGVCRPAGPRTTTSTASRGDAHALVARAVG